MQIQAPLLRNDQVVEMEEDKLAAENKLRNPQFQGDKGAVAVQLRALNEQLESQRPRAYGAAEIDAAVRREAELRGQWSQGMLSQEEMRKCPPGAADRHRAWEKHNLKAIEEWQNIRRRLNAGGEDTDYASIELYRPKINTMNMDNALIPGKLIFLPPAGAGAPVTFSAEQIALLAELAPELRDKLASMSNPQRAEVKEVLGGGIGLAAAPSQASIDGKRGADIRTAKRIISQEHKDKMRAGREAAAAKRKAA